MSLISDNLFPKSMHITSSMKQQSNYCNMKLNEWKHAWVSECKNEHTMVWFPRQQIFGAFSWWQKEAQDVGLKKKSLIYMIYHIWNLKVATFYTNNSTTRKFPEAISILVLFSLSCLILEISLFKNQLPGLSVMIHAFIYSCIITNIVTVPLLHILVH